MFHSLSYPTSDPNANRAIEMTVALANDVHNQIRQIDHRVLGLKAEIAQAFPQLAPVLTSSIVSPGLLGLQGQSPQGLPFTGGVGGIGLPPTVLGAPWLTPGILSDPRVLQSIAHGVNFPFQGSVSPFRGFY